MAKPTYYNLENDKRERLIDACMEEFSLYTFSDASINRIIKRTEISRGSFYQYFEDKEDCYMEMLGIIAQEKYRIFKDVAQAESNNVFEAYLNMLKQVQIWMEAQPRYYKIGILMELDKSNFIQKLVKQNPGMMDYFLSLIRRDQANGIIRPEVDPQLLSDMLIGINQKILMEHFVNKDYAKMIQTSQAVLELLQKGTMVR